MDSSNIKQFFINIIKEKLIQFLRARFIVSYNSKMTLKGIYFQYITSHHLYLKFVKEISDLFYDEEIKRYGVENKTFKSTFLNDINVTIKKNFTKVGSLVDTKYFNVMVKFFLYFYQINILIFYQNLLYIFIGS